MPKQLSPRERFQQDSNAVRGHIDFADSAAVRHSIDQALLQLTQRYTIDPGPTASLNFYRLQGAQDFIDTWLVLGDVPRRTDAKRTDELLDPDLPPPLKPKLTR